MRKQITRLSPAVVSQLRSSTILSNVAQIAEELVCNSLDAGATKIEIAVDGEACHMKVDDDGCGISREDLTLVGERHATSKLHCLNELEGGVTTLGFRGEALSSLSNVSLVEITSRCRRMPNTYRKTLKGGATLSIGLSSEQRTHGTTVVVKDMFYNQPVRRRLLNSSQRKIVQSVKECVMRHVLIHPQVSFTVKDLARKDIILHTNSAATLNSTLCNIFGAEVFSKLHEIDYAQGHLRLTGFLSKAYHSHPSKALQYLYINRRYVLKTALNKLINSYDGKSKDSMGRINMDERGARGEITSGRHLCPVFVLNLTCPFSDYDITFEASKTLVEFKDWDPVVTFVRNVILKIWGDQSVGSRQGNFQALESISAAHGKITPSNGNSHHRKTLKSPNASKGEIPPMAVRRALVQIDSLDTQEIPDEKWWDPDSFVPKTPLWSPSNDSLDIPRILNTLDFLPEISSCAPERTSTRAHPSYELTWPEFYSDHGENEITRSSRIRAKRQRADYVADDVELSNFFSVKSYSFSPESKDYSGSSEIIKANDRRWNLDNEDASVEMKEKGRHSDASETAFQDCIDYRIFSPNGEEHGDALQHQRHDFEIDAYSPRPKTRLDLDMDTSPDILKLHSEHCEKQKPCKEDQFLGSSASEINHTTRGSSGPPFYRPLKRHGVHLNPPNSLSTVERIGNEDERKPDTRSKIDLDAICGTNKSRDVADMPQTRTELIEIATIQPGGRGLDCSTQLSTQARPFLDSEEFENHEETIDVSAVERPSDTVTRSQQRVEVDVHERCKYRSTDMNNAAIGGENLPVDTVQGMFKEWSNPCMKKDDDILDLSSGILASNVSSLLPDSITKDVFKQARVLQQVDTKFIASVSCGILLLIDQHAADERVRLEELRNDVLGGNITKQISLLSSTQKLTMTFTEQQTLQTYSQQIQYWGWRFKIIAEKKPTTSQNKFWPSTGGTCKVLLSAVPSILGVRLTGPDLIEYLRQLTDTQGSSAPPPAVIRLLNNKACRGAIMFGDKLLPAECSQLVNHLKETLLCFQCAHGRPTMIPLVDMQALHRRFDPTCGSSRASADIDFHTWKTHRSGRGWHGLQSDFKPNVERARARLAHAQGV